LLTLLFFTIFYQISYGCDCIKNAQVDIEDVFETKYILRGKVLNTYIDTIKLEYETNAESYERKYEMLIAELEIQLFYKGGIEHSKVKLITPIPSSGLCGIDFKKGKEYIVWSNELIGEKYVVSLCSRTTNNEVTKKEQIQILDFYLKNKNKDIWKDENNLIRVKGNYKNKLPTGEWKFYNEKGCIKSKGYFNKGVKNDRWQKYDCDCREISTTTNCPLLNKIKPNLKCAAIVKEQLFYQEGELVKIIELDE